jgi:hypothetical protein
LPIEKYYRDDETFREIYDDYLTYLEAFRFWNQSSAEDALVRGREYEKLVGELEEELTDILMNKYVVSGKIIIRRKNSVNSRQKNRRKGGDCGSG